MCIADCFIASSFPVWSLLLHIIRMSEVSTNGILYTYKGSRLYVFSNKDKRLTFSVSSFLFLTMILLVGSENLEPYFLHYCTLRTHHHHVCLCHCTFIPHVMSENQLNSNDNSYYGHGQVLMLCFYRNFRQRWKLYITLKTLRMSNVQWRQVNWN